MPKFRDIPKFVRGASYIIDVGWDSVDKPIIVDYKSSMEVTK